MCLFILRERERENMFYKNLNKWLSAFPRDLALRGQVRFRGCSGAPPFPSVHLSPASSFRTCSNGAVSGKYAFLQGWVPVRLGIHEARADVCSPFSMGCPFLWVSREKWTPQGGD